MINLYINNNLNLADITDKVTLTSSFNNGASTLKFEFAFEPININMGDTVRFVVDGTTMFFGYIFDISTNGKTIKITAYDQLVYLANKNSYILKSQPLTQSINDISYLYSDGVRVRLGSIDNTEVNLKAKNVDDKTGLDIINELIDENRILNGYWYALYDENGALNLTDVVNMRLPLVIGDDSLCTSYDFNASIKKDTYNYVKSAKDDKTTGTRNIYVVEDSDSIKKWGKLVFYNKINSDLNEQQIKQQSKMILELKNRVTKELTVEALGDVRVRGGSGLKIEIASIGVNFWAIVKRVQHNFNGNQHTMILTLDWGGA